VWAEPVEGSGDVNTDFYLKKGMLSAKEGGKGGKGGTGIYAL
jgi:hypothetical protein